MNIVLIQGHPEAGGGRFCHALAAAYAEGAEAAGHSVRKIDVAELSFPLLRSQREWSTGEVPPDIAQAQESIRWAQHIVILYPMWLGEMPALLKGFLEQVLRPGFGTSAVEDGQHWTRLLTGRSARIVVTMGMPALAYRLWFGAHSLRSLKRNVLAFCGIGPLRDTLIGNVEGCGAAARGRWLEKLRALGREGR
ncbi:MAG: NAD(P)H-dependent oxidoreductase [Betaproteobacteria bacterium]